MEIIRYPSTYQAAIIRRVISISHVVTILLLGFFGRAQLDKSSSKTIWAIATIGLIISLIWKLNDSSSLIILYADRIEKKSWFSTKVWRRDEVAGLLLGSFGKFRLVRKYNKGDYFPIPAGIKRDIAWNVWLSGVPEFGKYDGSSTERRFAAGVIYVGFGALALMIASLSFHDFRNSFIIAHGVAVEGKILTVKNFKTGSSGWVEYSLPNGTACYDWLELAPNGAVRPGDDITVVVDRGCGHALSTKSPLHPWFYLLMAFAIIIIMSYQLLKLNNGGIRKINIA